MADIESRKTTNHTSLNTVTFIVAAVWLGVFFISSVIFSIIILSSAESSEFTFESVVQNVIFEFVIVAVYPIVRAVFYYSFIRIKNSFRKCDTDNHQILLQARNAYTKAKVFTVISVVLDLIFIPACVFIVYVGINWLKG